MPRTSSVTKPSNAEILTKNVRLLDLDEEFDWPCITQDTFSSNSGVQEQQRRSYAAQWLLYKFFQIWDSEWTRTNLYDLFPPLEPRQVGELRLRIYKQLTLLKRDGVFANDLFLRRTMFEDCKGPKFEELLAVFSSQVLQHKICEAGSEASRVRRMAKGELRLGGTQKIPMTLAYQSSFQNILHKRKLSEERWRAFGSTITAREHELHLMSAQLEGIISRRQEKRIPKRTLDRLHSTVQANWVGDYEWAEIILHSDQHRPQKAFLERPFSDIWSHACEDSLHLIRPRRNDSLLEELRLRVQRQNKRLAKWRAIHASLDSQEPNHGGEVAVAEEADSNARTAEMPPSDQVLETPKSAPHQKIRRSGSFEESDMEISGYEQEDEARGEPIISYGQLYSSPQVQWPSEDSISESQGDELVNQIIASVANAAPTPIRAPLTLAERTRLSMARLTPSKGTPAARTAESGAATRHMPAEPLTKPPLSPGSPGQYASLAERTRKSMSHMKTGQQARARKSRGFRVSNVYPINQFESPNRSGYGPAEFPDTSHLEERLDALASDEEMAFRSRPLLAHSPSLGPQPDAIEEDIEEEVEVLDE